MADVFDDAGDFSLRLDQSLRWHRWCAGLSESKCELVVDDTNVSDAMVFSQPLFTNSK